MITIDNIINTSEITNLKLDNSPKKSHLSNIKDFLKNCLLPIEKEWDVYCTQHHLGYGGITILRGYISEKNNIKLKICEHNNSPHFYGYAADTIPNNGKIVEYYDFLLSYFSNENFHELIEEKPRNGIPSWIHITYKDNKKNQNKKIYRLI